MVTRSEVWVCGPSLAAISDSNPAGTVDICLLSAWFVVR